MPRKPPEELEKAFRRVPVNRHLRFRLISRSKQGAVVSMDLQPRHLQEEGVVHGGILTAIADTAAVYSFFPDLEPDRTMASIELKVNFLRPAQLEEGPLFARSRVVQRGRKVGVADVEVTQSDKLVAKGTFTYMFFDRP